MGSDQSSQRSSRNNGNFYPSSLPSNYPPARPPPTYPSARAGTGVSTAALASTNNQQHLSPRGQNTQNTPRQPNQNTARIYPNLETAHQTTNAYGDILYPIQPAQRPTPSAPPANAVNNNNRNPNTNSRSRSNTPLRTQNKRSNTDNCCQTCKRPFGTAIYQCESGHASCETCKLGRRFCGLCSATITTTRNFALEEVYGEVKILCQNANVGCKVFVKRIDFDNHLKECPATERPCPLQSMGKAACHWKGNLYDVGAHFDFAHPTNRAADVDKEMIISNFSVFVEAKHHFIYLITVGTFNFLAHVSIDSDNILFGVQCCSSDMSAKKWIYEFHVYNKQNPRKKYLYTDTCISYHLPLVDMFKNCAVLPMFYAKGFLNSDTFSYKIYIKRQGQPPGEGRSRFRGRRNQNVE